MFCIFFLEIFLFFKKIREKIIDKNGEMKNNVCLVVWFMKIIN